MKKRLLALAVVSLSFGACGGKKNAHELMNVSYDPTREFYREFNDAFAAHWKTGHPQEAIEFKMSHGGSGKQARSVVDGLAADVVTLALAADIDVIQRETKLIPADWQKKLPHNSAPYTSTVVFVVRKGNPKGIKDWDDLIKPGVSVITPNPKTSGGARWNYLAAFAHGGRDFVSKLFKNVAVLDTGARGSTTTFTQRKIGDVLIAWENEAYLASKEMQREFEVVVPSLSILAEPTVALVEGNATRKGTTAVANAYLEFLYSETGQMLAGKHFFRPSNPVIAAKFPYFKKMKLITIDSAFGGWDKANKEHFADGGVFDQVYAK